MSASPRKRAYAGLTTVGRVRMHNEDAILLEPPLFAVADGLGGHDAGEIASSIALGALVEAAPRRPDAKALGRAVHAANRAVIAAAREGIGRSGMGTTLTAMMVSSTRVAVAHAGDSRAYVLRDNALLQLTDDHSLVADMIRHGTLTEEQSRTHPNRSVITRALGTDPNMRADTLELEALPGDRVILCSDGLSGMLSDSTITDILEEYRDPEVAVRMLANAAEDAGGHDNISVIVVDITAEGGRSRAAQRRVRGWASLFVWAFAFFSIVAITVLGTYRYAQNQAYLLAENDRVVIYRGVPGEFAGFTLRWPEAVTDVSVSALDPVTAARLAAGVPVESIESAWDLVEHYRARAATEVTPAPATTLSAPGGEDE